jgi:hypothetical protein
VSGRSSHRLGRRLVNALPVFPFSTATGIDIKICQGGGSVVGSGLWKVSLFVAFCHALGPSSTVRSGIYASRASAARPHRSCGATSFSWGPESTSLDLPARAFVYPY